MDFSALIEPGMSLEDSFEVGAEHTAARVGSGAAPVLATPWLVAYMERVAHRLLAERLPEGYSSVGVLVHIRHLAPTPEGSPVRVVCRVTQVEGPRVTFSIQAWDSTEQVGEAEHERVVIDQARFMRRVAAKQQPGR